MGHLELMLLNGLSEKSHDENLEGLEVAMDSCKLLISIIQDILDLSKIEAGQLDIAHNPISIRTMLENTMKLANAYRIQRKKSQIKLLSEIDVETFVSDRIFGDQFRLQQVLTNLLSNAIKFTDEGFVSLTIRRCQDDSSNIEFCIRDTGKGIPQDRLDIIFEPFRQVEFGDTRQHGGTGLGLTICKKLIEIMGGSLRVVSCADATTHGSQFIFTIPYQPAPSLTKEEEEKATMMESRRLRTHNMKRNSGVCSSSSGTETSSCQANSKHQIERRRSSLGGDSHTYSKILLAEDDLVSRKMAVRMLELAGYKVIVAKDGSEAVALFEQHQSEIGLILMDVMMPVMDGLEATERIREYELRNSLMCIGGGSNDVVGLVPIVALSAGAMKGDKERGLQAGMSDYLYKPVNRSQLLETLKLYLGEEDDAQQ